MLSSACPAFFSFFQAETASWTASRTAPPIPAWRFSSPTNVSLILLTRSLIDTEPDDCWLLPPVCVHMCVRAATKSSANCRKLSLRNCCCCQLFLLLLVLLAARE